MPRNGAVFYTDHGDLPAGKLKFGVGKPTSGRVSGIWTAAPAKGKSSDIFLTCTGLSQGIKVSFHPRDVIVAFMREKFENLRAVGIARSDQREICKVPVPKTLPWIAVEVTFYGRLLRSAPLPLPDDAPTVLLDPPRPGHLLRVVAVLSEGEPVDLTPQGLDFRRLGWVASGGGRHLSLFSAVFECDDQVQITAIRSELQKARFPLKPLDVPDDNLAAVGWGLNGDRLLFHEVHNLVVSRAR